MRILDWLAHKAGYIKPQPRPQRTYQAAKSDRLVAGWITSNTSADRELKESLPILRARSQQLLRDNDYAKRFVSLCITNIVGPQGIGLQNQARMRSDPTRLDERANAMIEEAWKRWGELGNPSMDGSQTWVDLQDLFVRSLVGNGESLYRQIRGPVNEDSFALHPIEPDQLDDRLNESNRGTRNDIKMGVELNGWGRPMAYHLLSSHPGDRVGYQATGTARVPADEITHGFIRHRIDQHRGAPWFHTAMLRLKHLGGYEEAELIASRLAASKMGFFTSPDGEGYTGESTEASTGASITEAEPGTFEQLPDGTDFKAWDPNHPAGNFDPFVKATLRGISAGLDVSYTSLSGDLTDVNFSSIRSGTLEMRDQWRFLQRWLIDHLIQPTFKSWYIMASLSGRIPFGIEEFDRLVRPTWSVRGWEWVDPLKDTTASVLAIQHGLTTRTRELAKTGQDYGETIEQLAQEEQLAADKGVTLGAAAPATPPANDEEAGKNA